VVNNTTIIKEKIVYAEPAAPQVIVAPSPYGSPMGGMVAPAPMFAPEPVVVAPAPSVGDLLVGAGAAMATKAIVDAIAPSPEKQMQEQMRQDERKLDQQAELLRQLQNQLAEAKK